MKLAIVDDATNAVIGDVSILKCTAESSVVSWQSVQ